MSDKTNYRKHHEKNGVRIVTGVIALCLELHDLLSSHYRSNGECAQWPMGDIP